MTSRAVAAALPAASPTHSSASLPLPSPPPSVVFGGLTWHRLCVPPCELRLEITLHNGQCFGWRRVDGAKKRNTNKRRKRQNDASGDDDAADASSPMMKQEELDALVADVRSSLDVGDAYARSVLKSEPLETDATFHSASDAAGTSAAPSNLAAPSATDPHYIGVMGRSLIGIRETPDDILYTEYCRGGEGDEGDATPTPIHELDAMLRDCFHLPPAGTNSQSQLQSASVANSSPASSSPILLSQLYSAWCASAPARFRFVASFYPGVRLLRQEPLECLFSFICSSNNNVARITQMLAAIRTEYGERLTLSPSVSARLQAVGIDADDQAFYVFPSLDRLCDAQEDRLREIGFGYRAKYIIASARLLRDRGGVAYLHSLRSPSVSRADAEKALLDFAGVGPKVASCVALFSLDRLDSIPCDTHVWQIALRDYADLARDVSGIDLRTVKSLTPRVIDAVGDVFRQVYGPLAGWAHCLLFLAELPDFKKRLAASGIDAIKEDESAANGGATTIKTEEVKEEDEAAAGKATDAKKPKGRKRQRGSARP